MPTWSSMAPSLSLRQSGAMEAAAAPRSAVDVRPVGRRRARRAAAALGARRPDRRAELRLRRRRRRPSRCSASTSTASTPSPASCSSSPAFYFAPEAAAGRVYYAIYVAVAPDRHRDLGVLRDQPRRRLHLPQQPRRRLILHLTTGALFALVAAIQSASTAPHCATPRRVRLEGQLELRARLEGAAGAGGAQGEEEDHAAADGHDPHLAADDRQGDRLLGLGGEGLEVDVARARARRRRCGRPRRGRRRPGAGSRRGSGGLSSGLWPVKTSRPPSSDLEEDRRPGRRAAGTRRGSRAGRGYQAMPPTAKATRLRRIRRSRRRGGPPAIGYFLPKGSGFGLLMRKITM